MGVFGSIIDILNKILPNRKAAMVEKLNNLTAKFQKALDEGRVTDAAIIKVQLAELRKVLGYTGGDV